MDEEAVVRFGLIGTGHWARATHAAALVAAEGADLVGVWGRRPEAAAALAADVGARAYDDVAALIDDVEAVAFAVPPDVQAPVAVQAARAGRHLLLEKPVALDPAAAAEVVEAVDAGGVASVVFFTGRFQPDQRGWLAGLREQGPWDGGWGVWLATALAEGSPYATSPWRRERGALWDIGPHALALLDAALGPVTGVRADRGAGDLVHLVLHHESGATSTATLTLAASVPGGYYETTFWGPGGTVRQPAPTTSAQEACGLAVHELVTAARTVDKRHPVDVRFGARVVELLAEAERQL